MLPTKAWGSGLQTRALPAGHAALHVGRRPHAPLQPGPGARSHHGENRRVAAQPEPNAGTWPVGRIPEASVSPGPPGEFRVLSLHSPPWTLEGSVSAPPVFFRGGSTAFRRFCRGTQPQVQDGKPRCAQWAGSRSTFQSRLGVHARPRSERLARRSSAAGARAAPGASRGLRREPRACAVPSAGGRTRSHPAGGPLSTSAPRPGSLDRDAIPQPLILPLPHQHRTWDWCPGETGPQGGRAEGDGGASDLGADGRGSKGRRAAGRTPGWSQCESFGAHSAVHSAEAFSQPEAKVGGTRPEGSHVTRRKPRARKRKCGVGPRSAPWRSLGRVPRPPGVIEDPRSLLPKEPGTASASLGARAPLSVGRL
ncbi:unnamed protein product [Rangifer tarandus platyrhynchus]|uniref:Uncharacterized protein n=2 Tax=Rangifer tarandus platyrhynchus TaxID=3082113 RepID=A0ABN8YEL1_RANTA|nr:unnamed protein product [Rangifer tarandus platyrhynchus]CAI9700304.1 unnamed protein product [Rangifer tarandus platyrhynchus]